MCCFFSNTLFVFSFTKWKELKGAPSSHRMPFVWDARSRMASKMSYWIVCKKPIFTSSSSPTHCAYFDRVNVKPADDRAENVSKRQMVKSFHDSLISCSKTLQRSSDAASSSSGNFHIFFLLCLRAEASSAAWAVFAVCGNWMTLHWLGALDSQLSILSSCVDSSGIVVQLPRQRRRLDLTILNLIFHYYFASFTAKKRDLQQLHRHTECLFFYYTWWPSSRTSCMNGCEFEQKQKKK